MYEHVNKATILGVNQSTLQHVADYCWLLKNIEQLHDNAFQARFRNSALPGLWWETSRNARLGA